MSRSPASKRLRVLHITRNLPPLLGGMERLNCQMVIELAREFEVAVVGPKGCRSALPKSVAVSEISARPLSTFFFGALLQGVRMARRFRPDIVLGGSGLAAPFVWVAAKLSGARSALYVHGLDLIVRHPLYRWFWRPFIRRADSCIANSRNTAELAVAIGVRASTIAVVHPGVDLPPAATQPGAFRSRFDLGDRPVLLSVGRLIERKGLAEFVECALPIIAEHFPDVCLIMLGEESPDLLSGSSAGLAARIRARSAQLRLDGNVRFIGRQDDATLAAAYLESDLHVFPVRDVAGDVEGFGMVAIEAAAHGTPTVAFAVGGVPDAIADGVSGALIAPGDYAQMAQCVIKALHARGDMQNRARARDFARPFAWTEFGEKIRGLLRALAASADSP